MNSAQQYPSIPAQLTPATRPPRSAPAGTQRRARGFVPVLLLLAVVASRHAAAVDEGTWNQNANQSWATAGNWTANQGTMPPNAQGAIAHFPNIINGNRTVSLDGSKTVGAIDFYETSNDYDITTGGGGPLVFSVGSGNATLSVLPGNTQTHRISSAVTLSSPLDASIGGSVEFQMNGATAINSLLRVTGGTLKLGTANSGSGGVTVDGAGSVVNGGNVSAFGAGLLTLQNGGTFLNSAGNVTYAYAITMNGGTILLQANGNLQLSGPMALTGGINTIDKVGGSVDLNYSGPRRDRHGAALRRLAPPTAEIAGMAQGGRSILRPVEDRFTVAVLLPG